MKIIALFLLLLPAFHTRAEINISRGERGPIMRAPVQPDDVVVIRTNDGPMAVLRFISLDEEKVSLFGYYFGGNQDVQSLEPWTVPLRQLPDGKRITTNPVRKRTTIQQGILAEAEIKAGPLLVLLSLDQDGTFGLEYSVAAARIFLVPSGMEAPETGTEP